MSDEGDKGRKRLSWITLIWEKIPEGVDIFIIPVNEISNREKRWLRLVNGRHIAKRDTVGMSITHPEDVAIAFSNVMRMIYSDGRLPWPYDEIVHNIQNFDESVPREALDEEIVRVKKFGKWFKYKISEGAKTLPRSRLYISGVYV